METAGFKNLPDHYNPVRGRKEFTGQPFLGLAKVVGDLVFGPAEETILAGIAREFIRWLDLRFRSIPFIAIMIKEYFSVHFVGQGH